MPEPTPDHHQCRFLKMDGVRCRNWIPLGHVFCHNHRFNRDPAFGKHNGKVRVPLMEDISSLQVTITATVHALLNHSLDRRDARVILSAVRAATGVLRLDLAERRFLAQTGQTRPQPVTDFAILGHERVAVEDGHPETCNPQPVTSNLDPADPFLTPETILALDEELRVPLPAPGQPDPLRIDGADWPCPYRFNYCKGPGPKASCHYCIGQMRWEDVHPSEPDPGAPGPLPTTQPVLTVAFPRDLAAPTPAAPSLSPSEAFPEQIALRQRVEWADRAGKHNSEPDLSTADNPTSLDKKQKNVIMSEPSECVAPALGRNCQSSRESCHPERRPSSARQVEWANGPAFPSPAPTILPAPQAPPADPETDRWLSARRPLPDGEEWLPALTPLDPEPETIPVLVAAATPASRPAAPKRYQCPSTKSATSLPDPPCFFHFFRTHTHALPSESPRGSRVTPSECERRATFGANTQSVPQSVRRSDVR